MPGSRRGILARFDETLGRVLPHSLAHATAIGFGFGVEVK